MFPFQAVSGCPTSRPLDDRTELVGSLVLAFSCQAIDCVAKARVNVIFARPLSLWRKTEPDEILPGVAFFDVANTMFENRVLRELPFWEFFGSP